ncbi:MAG: hypothetical protein LBP32_05110 [Spirochaetaceae bacterium]|jgi:hypothetical protein|nr:hypothetical protein [Spirochaetaceae bacterium]
MMKYPRTRRLLKLIACGALLCGPRYISTAQEVDRAELEKNQAPVIFINFEGPLARFDTREQIVNIGYSLGLNVRNNTVRSGPFNRYFVIHSVSPQEGDRLDADIFGLGVDVGVDHIRNLRYILQGYLRGAYDYSPADAALLAEYVTIYNAVFRGTWDYFNSRYKSPVLGELAPEKAGLSIRFDEWPGRTLMIIPLGTGRPGSLSAVNTTPLTSPEVITEMRRETDRGIDRRQEMVALKEREADEASQTAALRREAIIQEEARIAEERAAVAEERAAVAEERAAVAGEREAVTGEREAVAEERRQAQGEVGANQEIGAPAGEVASAGGTQSAARSTEAELAVREAEAGRKEAELDQREAALDQERSEAAAGEAFADRKIIEARQEREDIARDQQEIIDQGPQSQEAGVMGIRIAGANSSLGRIVKLNPAYGGEINSSALNTIDVRTVTFIQGKLIAVAGENRGNGAIRLVEINPGTLEMVKQGNDDIHPGSLLWVNGNNIYAIVSSGGKLNLARFNADFVVQAKSAVTVHPFASVLIQDGRLLTQYDDGRAALLDPQDLTELRR